MPASVIAAVPPGRTRASLVWMWVCVPITAVTRPSSQRVTATFSLVASAWKSTSTTRAPRRASSTSSSTTSNGPTGVFRKSWPSRLTTATGVPSAAGRTVSPRPGEPDATFAGRTTRSDSAKYGPISGRRQTWLPSVIASAPAASSRSASRGVMPAPSAAFSPLTTQKSIARSSRSSGSRSSTARRPGTPKTSATNRMFSSGSFQGGGRPNLDLDVVAGVLRVARERLLLHAREVQDDAELRGAGGDARADHERRIRLDVSDRDHERGGARGLDVDLRAEALAVDDVGRQPDHSSVDRRRDICPRQRADVESRTARSLAAGELVPADPAPGPA